MKEWRVHVTQHYSFALDQVHVVMGLVGDGMFHPVKPVDLEFLPGIPKGTTHTEELPVTVLPRELAEQLVSRIGFCLLGVDDPLREISRLRADLRRAHTQLEKLIDGIGRLGDNDA